MDFKIGDRVRVVSDGYGCCAVGAKGTICEIRNSSVGVRLDTRFSNLHDCSGHCEHGYGWYFLNDEVELISPQQLQETTEPQELKLVTPEELSKVANSTMVFNTIDINGGQWVQFGTDEEGIWFISKDKYDAIYTHNQVVSHISRPDFLSEYQDVLVPLTQTHEELVPYNKRDISSEQLAIIPTAELCGEFSNMLYCTGDWVPLNSKFNKQFVGVQGSQVDTYDRTPNKVNLVIKFRKINTETEVA